MIDKTISHYYVLEKLGEGGMGVVYKAQDTRLERFVALKFLPDDLANDTEWRNRFLREAKSASALNHPNICTIYDIGEDNGREFIAMEFLDGVTLRELVRQGPLDTERLLDISLQTLDGLQAAHAEGIVHRDVKLANVFVTKSGRVKILDFGLAKKSPSRRAALVGASHNSGPGLLEEHMTSGLAALGTAAYMSPEQALGKPLDLRTDLFSFGIVLYEMATGKVPFHGDTTGLLFLSIVQEQPQPACEMNPDVPEQLQQIINKCLEKDRDRRYQSAAEIRADLRALRHDLRGSGALAAIVDDDDEPPAAVEPQRESDNDQRGERSSGKQVAVETAAPTAQQPVETVKPRWKKAVAAAVVLFVVMGGGLLYFRSHRAAALTEKDPIVLADFVNTTGETIFDGTLRQAAALDLKQSPFLNVIPDRRVAATLRLMDKSANERLTQEVAREVCLRTNSKAMVVGSIAQSGAGYEIGLKALNCTTMEEIAGVRSEAEDRERVLKALDKVDNDLRRKLGESLPSLEKFDKPLMEATTSSLEALQAYSEGMSAATHRGIAEAIPLLERATQLDPNFALAYSSLGVQQNNLFQRDTGRQNMRRAYELRNRVSENERFYIESNYYWNVTGEHDKAMQVAEEWARTFPNEVNPRIRIALGHMDRGEYEESARWLREAKQVNPDYTNAYVNLMVAYAALGRFDEAKEIFDEAMKHKLDNEGLRVNRFELAFAEHDETAMQEQLAWAKGKPGYSDRLLANEADAKAFYGQMASARELTQQAMGEATRVNASERSGEYEAAAAWREAETGNYAAARKWANEAVAKTNSISVKGWAALALARAGDVVAAEKLAAELNQMEPNDTLVQRNTLPAVRALVELDKQHPEKALEILRQSPPYDMGPGPYVALEPVYVRGLAYLRAGKGREAVAEFEKLVLYHAVVEPEISGALVKLQLGRAYAMAGDGDAARKEYQDFLALWKDADGDEPVLRQAKAEYAKLNARVHVGRVTERNAGSDARAVAGP